MNGQLRLMVVALIASAISYCALGADTMKVSRAMEPVCNASGGASCKFEGFVGNRIKVNERNWLLQAPKSNPAMLQMFRDRDRSESPDLNPWSGEFAGKYLTSAVQCYRLTRDKELLKNLRGFVKEFVSTQADDGYLGPWPASRRMTGKGIWDLWGQYHCMLGLYMWYEETGDKDALSACRRCADYFTSYFLDGGRRVAEAGDFEMNESCAHIFVLLYRETGEERYLRMAREIEKDFESPGSGDYIRQALAGKEYFQMPQHRWEGLHAIQSIAEMYYATGDEKYRQAFERIWWSIAKLDRHNTGGFSSGEAAQGNPYHQGAIETCCTIAWMALTVDMLRLTTNPRVADELELSTLNSVLGSQEPNGRWYTYNTPMDGLRLASAHEIAFQCRPGSPELNCCSVNAPRGLGFLSEWAVMRDKAGAVVINYYGPSEFRMDKLIIKQETDYPRSGKVSVRISSDAPRTDALKFRIPAWSEKTRVLVNGRETDASAGTYLTISREWKTGDTVEIEFDMRPWFWAGERECEGKVSAYIGPVLLAYDPRFDAFDADKLPEPDLRARPERISGGGYEPQPWMLVRWPAKGGGAITLCDFASAGNAGTRYRSWLPAPGMEAVDFSKTNLLRMQRAGE